MPLIHQQAAIRKDNKTGIRGVCRINKGSQRGRYRAYCAWQGKFYSLGIYDDPLDAGIVASEFRERMFPPLEEPPKCTRCKNRPSTGKGGCGLCTRCYMKDYHQGKRYPNADNRMGEQG